MKMIKLAFVARLGHSLFWSIDDDDNSDNKFSSNLVLLTEVCMLSDRRFGLWRSIQVVSDAISQLTLEVNCVDCGLCVCIQTVLMFIYVYIF